MRNKVKFLSAFFLVAAFVASVHAATIVEEEIIDTDDAAEISMEELSADAVAAYNVEGSLFQQITDLEQEKVLMQLEKERAQLDLELDRLAAEKIKLHMEIDTLSGRAEAQQQEMETERAKLEAEAARLAREKENLLAEAQAAADTPKATVRSASKDVVKDSSISEKYRLVNVIGAGNQLQATLEDLTTGQNRRVAVGKTMDGYTVKSISLYDGVVFVKDGETQTLNVTGGK